MSLNFCARKNRLQIVINKTSNVPLNPYAFPIYFYGGARMKYKPANREEPKALCNDESVYLGDIDTSFITDMNNLFCGSKRGEYSGIEKWDTSKYTLF